MYCKDLLRNGKSEITKQSLGVWEVALLTWTCSKFLFEFCFVTYNYLCSDILLMPGIVGF